MRNSSILGLTATICFLFIGLNSAEAQQPSRLQGKLDPARRVALGGRVPRDARPQNDLGAVDPAFELPDVMVVLKPSAEAQANLNRLLAEQQDPGSPNFHKWLTPEQYGERFGASESDLKQISDWLQSEGLVVSEVARGRNWIAANATAATARRAFGTEIHRYRVNGETHFANANEPTIPAALANLVTGIRGLNDFRMKPRLHRLAPRNTTSGSVHHLVPDDIATIYNIAPLYADHVDGSGQRIVVVGQTAIRTTDIDSFRSRYGLSAINLEQNLVGRRSPGIVDGDVDEAHLDIEWAGAVARNATIVYVYSSDVWRSAIDAVSNNRGTVISMSYGFCEQADLANQPTYQQTAQQAAVQGMSWVAASGDSGAGDCEVDSNVAQNGLAVDSPAAIPEITSMGGTMFDDTAVPTQYWNATNTATGGSARSYIPEKVWNESGSTQLLGGGGGASVVFPRPSWQTGPGVPNDGARHVPDLALASAVGHDGYYMYSAGLFPVGGTSVAAPVMAGVTALLNHYLVSTGALAQPGLGNLNPALYRLAQTTSGVFHDVTSGDNTVPCAAGSPDCVNGFLGHKAGPGYDMATGLGSIDAYNLAHSWSNRAPISSAVVPSINGTPIFQTGNAWKFTVTLTEEAGIPTTLTDFTVDGVSRTAEIASLFGSASIGARQSISANLTMSSVAVPKTVVFLFKGVDASGAPWTAEIDAPFRGPQARLAVGGISNAASGQQVYAPGMILSVYGTGLGNTVQSAAAIPLPSYLSGFMAFVNGVPAPLYFVSPNQVNIQIPYETLPGPATLNLSNPFETVNYQFTVASTGPGIFTFPDGGVNPSRSAKRGDVATLFVTGEGAVTPSLATGASPSSSTPVSRLPQPRNAPAVMVGGVPATIRFAGIPSGLVGVTQINFEIPAGAAAGLQDVVVTIGGQASNTAKIMVQ